MLKRLAVTGVVLLAFAACSGDGTVRLREASGDSKPAGKPSSKPATGKPSTKAARAEPGPAKRVDPRKGGFEIGLGEWAVTPEAESIRPGRVTFVINNRGTMPHGFEIELEGESSGHGSGDLFKAESELLQPGESTRMSVTLMPGLHKIECLVDGHDDMGMERMFDVRADAPLVKVNSKASAAPDKVSIADFAFQPDGVTVDAGTEVTWSNDDPAPHTVTSLDEAFDSDILDPGATFSFKFDKAGVYAYRCNVHPDMKGKVTVE